jgi:hypothetical protein
MVKKKMPSFYGTESLSCAENTLTKKRVQAEGYYTIRAQYSHRTQLFFLISGA